MKNRPLALTGQYVDSFIIGSSWVAGGGTGDCQSSLPTLGDGGDITASAEAAAGRWHHPATTTGLHRRPGAHGYVQALWRALLAAARERGELSPNWMSVLPGRCC